MSTNRSHQLNLSLGRDKHDNNPKLWQGTVDDFFKQLETPRRGKLSTEEYTTADDIIRDQEKDGAFFISSTFTKGLRQVDVTHVTGFVLDIDWGNWTEEAIQEQLIGLKYKACSTHSSLPGNKKWRVFIPYASPTTTKEEHEEIWQYFYEKFGGDLDPRSKTRNQLWYLPSCPADSEFHHFEGEGELFDPHRVAPKQKQATERLETFKAPETIPQGGRNDSLFRLGCSLQSKGLAPEAIHAAVLAENLAKCSPPLPESEVLNIVGGVLSRYEPGLAVVEREHLTDLGNARRLVARHGENLRFIPPFKKWMGWDGSRWCHDKDGAIERCAKETVRQIHREAADEPNDDKRRALSKWAYQSESAGRLKNMVDLAKTEPGIPLSPSSLDANPWLLGVANGVLDLRTGGLREPRREDYITKRAPVVFDPNAKCARWISFLECIMAGNQELIHFLQKAVGYSLTGSTREQVLFLSYGNGANGKSVFLRTIASLCGDYATQTSAESLMIKRGGGPSNEIARLHGARFVAASEVEDGQRLAESLIKQMTGEDDMVARFLYCEHFTFKPAFKLWIAANHKPVIRGDDYAIWRRIHLIPFGVTIPEEERDGELAEKLLIELPGILNWVLEGCRLWQKEGLRPPEKVKAATAEYRSEMDVIRTWLESRCIENASAKTSASQLYENYNEWATENIGWAMSQTKFGRKLSEHGYRKERSSVVMYHGLELVAEAF